VLHTNPNQLTRRRFKQLKKKMHEIAVPFRLRAYKLFAPKEISIVPFYTSVPPVARKIPNSVYQKWNGPFLPYMHAMEVRRFRRLNPDYSFVFFDDKRMNDYMSSRYEGHPILDVFRQIQIPASKVDVWRYCILYQEGGVYCDIDSALSVPLRELLKDDPSEVISFENNKWRDVLSPGSYADPKIFFSGPPREATQNLDYPDHLVLQWLLCFEKGSPILEEVINLIARHFEFFRGKEFESVWKAVIHCTGAVAFTQAVWKWISRTKKRPYQCGIDYQGEGVWKVPGSWHLHDAIPHYSQWPTSSLTNPRPER